MTALLLTIRWDVSPELLQFGDFAMRWYGLLFALGFVFGLWMVTKMFEAEGAPKEWLDQIFFFL